MLAKPLRLFLLVCLGIVVTLPFYACSGIQSTNEIPASPDLKPPTVEATTSLPAITQAARENSDTLTTTQPIQSQDCVEKTGSVEPFLITRNGIELSGSIYTPPCYGETPDFRYPSLYLLHGATETDQQWLDLGIAEEADRLIKSMVIPPLIIVLPLELTWVALPENPFGDYLVTELVPWVDNQYQTLADSEYRAIGGLSRGGNWAVRIGMLHWGHFGSIGAHSTPLFYGDDNRIQGWAEVIPTSRLPEIYLDIGEDDNNMEAAQDFQEKLYEIEIPHEWIVNTGLHDEIYWSTHIDDYLLWYSSGWQDIIK